MVLLSWLQINMILFMLLTTGLQKVIEIETSTEVTQRYLPELIPLLLMKIYLWMYCAHI